MPMSRPSFVNDEIVVEIYIFRIIQIFLSIQFQLMGHFATLPIIFSPRRKVLGNILSIISKDIAYIAVRLEFPN